MTRITAQAIIDLLPIVADRGWFITHGGAIRDYDGRCPACALVFELSNGGIDYKGSINFALGALLANSMSRNEIEQMYLFARAADWETGAAFWSTAQARLREEIKANLGIK